jgi:deoxyribonuclease-1
MSRTPANKTLLGFAIAVILAILSALGYQLPKWLTGTRAPTSSERPTDLPTTAGSFSTAKDWLYQKVYYGQPKTFYCGCDYPLTGDRAGPIDLRSCGLQARQNAERAQRVEAEHVFPAAQFGNFRKCWRKPRDFPECIKSSGEILSGRACCEKVDPVFETAHNDLYNLFPAEGEINGDRRDYNWGMAPGAARDYGRCAFKIDASLRRAEPPDAVKGDIARAMFYRSETYGFNLSNQDRQLYTAWSRQDPPDAWEQTRNRRIAAIQGWDNPFISQYASRFGKTAAASTPPPRPTPAPAAKPAFTCDAKTTCGQMSSCDEARFYLTQCGLTRLDGDGDGVPCASLCRR